MLLSNNLPQGHVKLVGEVALLSLLWFGVGSIKSEGPDDPTTVRRNGGISKS